MPPFFVSNADRLNGVSPITTSHFHLQSHCTMATIGITKQKQGSHRRNQSRQDGSNSRAKVGTGYGVHKVLTPEEIVMKKFIGKQRRYWRSPRGQNTARVLPVLAVAGVALVVSYGHIYHVVHHAGETPLTAAIIPFSVDGLLITSARYIGHTRTWAGRCWAYLGFVIAMTATLAGNILAAEPDALGRGVAAWPAIAVIVTGGILHWGNRKPRSKPRSRQGTVTATSNGHARREALRVA